MKFLDLFSGIGGIRLGLENTGHNCIGYVEKDKYARLSYQEMYNTSNEWTREDITKVEDSEWEKLEGKVDLIVGGFPCQTFSIAGGREGFLNKTKGTMFFEIVRCVKIIKPKYVFMENVKGLMNHDNGETFKTVIKTMNEIGYSFQFEVLNSKFWGVPQNRERVYMVCIRKGEERINILRELKEKQEGKINKEKLKDFLEDEVNEKYYLKSETAKKLLFEMKDKVEEKECCDATLNNPKIIDVANCITARYDCGIQNYRSVGVSVIEKVKIKNATKKGYLECSVYDGIDLGYPDSKTRRGRVQKESIQTLTTSDSLGVLESDYRIRKLTPKECFRLQGFKDKQFSKAERVVSNSQLYKQAGNSVTVNVIEEIGKKLKELEK